ncbi:hypothetical protein J437_LFUL003691 [Ladona fulva]|uniref:Uncharacterized protein n=1 Tax=Ladona fulva TaxID=123851 RepID=A0A8K0JW06_LADFU|nr:hypothetical protein J437_LFUL003691 [Ladona fulva]
MPSVGRQDSIRNAQVVVRPCFSFFTASMSVLGLTACDGRRMRRDGIGNEMVDGKMVRGMWAALCLSAPLSWVRIFVGYVRRLPGALTLISKRYWSRIAPFVCLVEPLSNKCKENFIHLTEAVSRAELLRISRILAMSVSIKKLSGCDVALWNKSISQRWRRLRRRCSSFSSAHSPTTQHLLDSPSTISSPDSPATLPRKDAATPPPRADEDSISTTSTSSTPRSLLPENLRHKFSQLNLGLRKRRALSVHEVPSTFYVPSPLPPGLREEGPSSLPPQVPEARPPRRRAVISAHVAGGGVLAYGSLDRRGFRPSDDADRRSTDSNRSSSSASSALSSSSSSAARTPSGQRVVSDRAAIRGSESSSTLWDAGYCTESASGSCAEEIDTGGPRTRHRRWSLADSTYQVQVPSPHLIGGHQVLTGYRVREYHLSRGMSDSGPSSLPYLSHGGDDALVEDSVGERREQQLLAQCQAVQEEQRRKAVHHHHLLRERGGYGSLREVEGGSSSAAAAAAAAACAKAALVKKMAERREEEVRKAASEGRRTPSEGRRTPSEGRRTPSEGRRTPSRARELEPLTTEEEIRLALHRRPLLLPRVSLERSNKTTAIGEHPQRQEVTSPTNRSENKVCVRFSR